MDVSSVMLLLFAIAVVGVFYFIPTLIATTRGHHQTLWIFLVNLIGGITGMAWIVALIWSLLPARPAAARYCEGGWW